MISAEDNAKLKRLVSDYCIISSKAVARLYKGQDGRWMKISAGVATLEVHKPKNSMYIGLYSLTTESKVFETGLYVEMNYENSSSKFHSFSGDGISYGLSFPDVNDAQHFFTSVTTFCPRPLPRSLSFNRAKFGNKGTKLVNAFKKHKSIFGRRSDRGVDVPITLGAYEHTKHIGFTMDNGFKVSAENEALAFELLEALQLKVASEQEMADVMNVIDKFGASKVRDALDSRNANRGEERKRRPAPRPDWQTADPTVPQPPSPPSFQAPSVIDGRQNLLDSIISFDHRKLSKVGLNERKESAANIMDSIGLALNDMLSQRRGHLSDSESENGSDF